MDIFTKIRHFDISSYKKVKTIQEEENGFFKGHYVEKNYQKKENNKLQCIPIILPIIGQSLENIEGTKTINQDDGRVSRYDNVSRPFSRLSLSTGDISLRSKDTGTILEEGNNKKGFWSDFLYGSRRSIFNSLMNVSRKDISNNEDCSRKKSKYYSPIYLKIKIFYDRFNLRHFAPFLILLIYAFLGAGLFYYIEHTNEIEMKQLEENQLNILRNKTLDRLKNIMLDDVITLKSKLITAKDIFNHYEKELLRLKGEQRLDWDFIGALYYVGSIMTTIGYGNIYCRTNIGRGFTIIYSVISIPLVLAILSHCGRTLTTFFSNKWIRYRNRLKKKKQNLLKNKKIDKNNSGVGIKNGDTFITINDEDNDKSIIENHIRESRTIPIWLALFLCIGWICFCAGLFCIWEKKWSYYTSLYFFFISLSTIGLGDVVPDHPHMLVLLFCLVIIGLSIVSMLLSVIQIKIEEWFYDLMMKMQEEYRKAMENGDTEKANEIREHLLDGEPWYMKQMASHLLSDNQNTKLDEVAEKYEMVMKSTNTRYVQTDNTIKSKNIGTGSGIIELQSNDTISIIEDIPEIIDDYEKQQNCKIESDYSSVDEFEEDNSSIADALSLPYDGTEEVSVNINSLTEEEKLINSLIKKIELCDNNVETLLKNEESNIMEIDDNKNINNNECQKMVNRSVENLYSEINPRKKYNELGTMTLLNLAEDETQTSEKCYYDKECSTIGLIEVCDANNGTSKINSRTISLNTDFINVSTSIDENFDCCEDRSQQTSIREDNKISEMTKKYELEISEMKGRLAEMEKLYSSTLSIQSPAHSDTSVQCHSLSGSPGPSLIHIAISTTPPPESVDVGMMTTLTSNHIKKMENVNKNKKKNNNIKKENDKIDEIKKPIKHDLIIQTDDSYLKIARRLNEYKTQKSTNLSVVAAKPLNANEINSLNYNGNIPPSERREYSKEPNSIRKKFGTIKRKLQRSKGVRSPDNEIQAMSVSYCGVNEEAKYNLIPDRMFCSDDGSGMDFDNKNDDITVGDGNIRHNASNITLCGSLNVSSNEEKNFSSSESKGSISRKASISSIDRQKSLPPNIQRGKVLEYITQHEKGVHDPGTEKGRRKSLITIIDMRDQNC
uniref:Potassium channel domain-containing protein n=1 Tax=Strongyloides stercoralis TaxID=6248 RepID=A0A0K0DXH0_STRER